MDRSAAGLVFVLGGWKTEEMATNNDYYPTKADRSYISGVMRAPMLEREYEAKLARKWRDQNDVAAMHEIVQAHTRLVVRMASKLKGYGLPIGELIQEGNSGLLEAAKRFDPERNVRFSTYATWWVMAAMQDYIVKNSSIVRIGTTPAQKKLFFNLRKLRSTITDRVERNMTAEEKKTIASKLHVPIAAVERMESFFSLSDQSLNTKLGDNNSEELLHLLSDNTQSPEEVVTATKDNETRKKWLNQALAQLTSREREIITSRFLKEEKITLAEIGKSLGVTKERIRQIEGKALAKLKFTLESKGIHGGLVFL